MASVNFWTVCSTIWWVSMDQCIIFQRIFISEKHGRLSVASVPWSSWNCLHSGQWRTDIVVHQEDPRACSSMKSDIRYVDFILIPNIQVCFSISHVNILSCSHGACGRPPSFCGIWEKSVMRIKRRALVCGYNLQNHSRFGRCLLVAFPLLPHSPKQMKLVDHDLYLQDV